VGLQRLQNQAVDLLLEARLGGSQIAGQVLRSVVTDGQVEKESLSRSDRQAFAELKADVLYRWSAREPAITAELPGWLPGPVSQKIWRNVVNAQEQNQLESAEEARALKKQ
jgi:hypothetical protein